MCVCVCVCAFAVGVRPCPSRSVTACPPLFSLTHAHKHTRTLCVPQAQTHTRTHFLSISVSVSCCTSRTEGVELGEELQRLEVEERKHNHDEIQRDVICAPVLLKPATAAAAAVCRRRMEIIHRCVQKRRHEHLREQPSLRQRGNA